MRKYENGWILVILPQTKASLVEFSENHFKIIFPKNVPTKWHDIFTKQVLDITDKYFYKKLFSNFQFSVLKSN